MPQNERNAARDRKRREPGRHASEKAKRYASGRHEEKQPRPQGVNGGKSLRMSSDRENDLYERQSI